MTEARKDLKGRKEKVSLLSLSFWDRTFIFFCPRATVLGPSDSRTYTRGPLFAGLSLVSDWLSPSAVLVSQVFGTQINYTTSFLCSWLANSWTTPHLHTIWPNSHNIDPLIHIFIYPFGSLSLENPDLAISETLLTIIKFRILKIQ